MWKTLIPNIKAVALHETFIFAVAAVATVFNKALAQNTLPVDKIYFQNKKTSNSVIMISSTVIIP